MFGGGPSNLAWFQLGKWSEENAQRNRRRRRHSLGQPSGRGGPILH